MQRRKLRNADTVFLEVAKHFIRTSGYGVTLNASCLTEKQNGSSLLGLAHGPSLTTRVFVDGSISVHLGELELSDGCTEHIECDGRSILHLRERFAEEIPVGGNIIQPTQHLVANGEVVSRKIETRRFGPLGGRDKCLGGQQVGQIGKCGSFRQRKDEPKVIVKRIVR